MSIGIGHHLHLIDGSGFIFRAYHALPPLKRNSDGLPVGAVSGFCNILYKLLGDYTEANAPTHLAVVFDAKGKSFRSDIYADYKMNRPPPPEDLIPQFPLTREATRAFNVACIELENYEADDIIATLAKTARDAGARVTIISSDKDLMQLVGDGVEMLDIMKNKRIGIEQVQKKFGVYPDRVVDVQALAGDSVDNIPGAPGIGIKTAALLINEFGDLDSLLERANEIKQPKRRQALIEYAEQIRISRELVRLHLNTPIEYSFEDFEVKPLDPESILDFLKRMEFRTMSARLAHKLGVPIPDMPRVSSVSTSNHNTIQEQTTQLPFNYEKYDCISHIKQLHSWINQIYERGYVAVDTETTGLNEMCVDLVGISLCVETGKACYIPLTHKSKSNDLFNDDQLCENQINLTQALDLLRPVLQDDSILKIGQNIKYDYKIFARYGIHLQSFDDTMLLSYALNGGKHNHSMDSLSQRYLNHQPMGIKTLLGSGKSAITFDKVPIDAATQYAAEDADITLRLWHIFKPQLHHAQVTQVYEGLERPLIDVLAHMEMTGILIDKEHLRRMSNSFAHSIVKLETDIYELAGETFNVASPKQLGAILFDKMKLPGGKKGKTGAYATGVDILEDLAAEGYELPSRVLEWRQMSKLKSTYTDALQTHINSQTGGRVHTSYIISGASTGRLASTDPNLQNIPIRTNVGRKIREAFIAGEGNLLLSLDYSQIELRILAHIAQIDNLQQAFHQGVDIHALTASQMFDVPIENMDPMIRRQAKAINFGIIYGISGFGLARNLRIPRKEAQAFIDMYFKRFPSIRNYMDNTIEFAKEHGYVKTLFGRKIHTGEINTKGPQAGFAKRAAINAPIQGTAADIIRRAMIKIPDVIEHLNAKMLLQVHDELIFEVAEADVNKTINMVRSIMETAHHPIIDLTVPLVIDAGIGKNWAEAH